MSNRLFIFFAAIIGNVLEYYDFTVYSVFSLVIGRAFFPSSSEFAQVLASLGVFAVGFITRPIGGILFGYIGDKYGRRFALICSMLGMSVPTLLIGLLPEYDKVGIYAPLLLVIMRLLQGLCISGEGAGTAIFVLEHNQKIKPGLVTSIVHSSNTAGTLIATSLGIFLEYIVLDSNVAWRVAFILGGILGLAGFYLRLKVSETPIFELMNKKNKVNKKSLFEVIKTSWRNMFLTFYVGAVTSSIVYLVKSYVPIHYEQVLGLNHSQALSYLFYASCVLMVSIIIFGGLVDIFDKVKIMIFAAISIIVLAIPVLLMMSAIDIWVHIVALTILSILAGAISGGAYIFVISLFSPEERFFGVSFSYNLGIAMFGGTSPVIAGWLVANLGLNYAPAFYIMTTSSIFLLLMYFMRRSILNRA